MSKIYKRFVETAAGHVHVQEAGSGPRTLVLLSITSFGGALVDRVLPGLAELGYRAMAIDLMGYGRSDKRDKDWFVETFADNVEEVLAVCDIGQFGLVCGHFSGWMGIEIAGRNRPALKALMLDGTPFISAETRRANLERGPVPSTVWTEDGTHAIEYWKRAYGILKKLNPAMTLNVQPEQKLREIYVALLESLIFEPNTMAAANHFDIENKLPLVNVPTMVMCGDFDWNLPHHEKFLAAIANSTNLRLPGVHPLHEFLKPERASEYVAHVHQFFKPLL